jgi:hypothetical protein
VFASGVRSKSDAPHPFTIIEDLDVRPLQKTRGAARESRLDRRAYWTKGYLSYRQLWSTIEQLRHVAAFEPTRVLEIGVGNGFVAQILRSMDIEVTTFDINAQLRPDIVGDVTQVGDHVAPGEYDLVSCCEVLEHLPFDHFEPTIATFAALSPRLFLTIPSAARHVGMAGLIRLPLIGDRWFGAWLGLGRRRKLARAHFWEVGSENETSARAVTAALRRHYRRVESGQFRLNPYHLYFRAEHDANVRNHRRGQGL